MALALCATEKFQAEEGGPRQQPQANETEQGKVHGISPVQQAE